MAYLQRSKLNIGVFVSYTAFQRLHSLLWLDTLRPYDIGDFKIQCNVFSIHILEDRDTTHLPRLARPVEHTGLMKWPARFAHRVQNPMQTILTPYSLYWERRSERRVSTDSEALIAVPKRVFKYLSAPLGFCGYFFFCTKSKSIQNQDCKGLSLVPRSVLIFTSHLDA